MAVEYPDVFPSPLIDSFAINVQMGTVRSPQAGHQLQRRLWNTMPHTFTLGFVISVADWPLWQSWVRTNAYGWFNMNLPNLYSSLDGQLLGLTTIRFTSPVTAVNVTEKDVQLSVQAEMSPSMFARYLAV